MSFAPLTINTETFNQVGPGKYMNSNVTFGDAMDYILIKGGSLNRKTSVTTASVTCNIEKDISIAGGDPERKMCSVQVVAQVPSGFTTAEVDNMLERISEFFTVSNLERLLQGEQ